MGSAPTASEDGCCVRGPLRRPARPRRRTRAGPTCWGCRPTVGSAEVSPPLPASLSGVGSAARTRPMSEIHVTHQYLEEDAGNAVRHDYSRWTPAIMPTPHGLGTTRERRHASEAADPFQRRTSWRIVVWRRPLPA